MFEMFHFFYKYLEYLNISHQYLEHFLIFSTSILDQLEPFSINVWNQVSELMPITSDAVPLVRKLTKKRGCRLLNVQHSVLHKI